MLSDEVEEERVGGVGSIRHSQVVLIGGVVLSPLMD